MSPAKYTDEHWADLPSLMTITEAAAFLRVHRNTITSMLKEGQLPYVMVGDKKRIAKIELLRYLGFADREEN